MAELAREELADIARFSDNIDALTTRIVDRVRELNSTLPSLPGCAELIAAKLISEAANMTRFKVKPRSPATRESLPCPRGRGRHKVG